MCLHVGFYIHTISDTRYGQIYQYQHPNQIIDTTLDVVLNAHLVLKKSQNSKFCQPHSLTDIVARLETKQSSAQPPFSQE